jgi:hypothetical protein
MDAAAFSARLAWRAAEPDKETCVKKKRIPDGLRAWIDARKRHHLSHAQVQMARELGMNPRKLGGLDNHRQERWKLPLPLFIEELYRKRFGRARPEFVLSIEEHARQQEKKKRAEKREAKLLRRKADAARVGAAVGKVVEPGRGLVSGDDPSS